MQDVFTISLNDSSVEFTAKKEETLLEAALRQGVNLPHSCQQGDCGQCSAQVVEGDYRDESHAAKVANEIYTCRTKALSDLTLDVAIFPELQGIEVKTLPAKVDALKQVAPDVMVINLRFPPKESFHFLPGQFIDILFKGQRRSYSIASSHVDNKQLELHIRAVEGGLFTTHVFNDMKENELIRFEGPLGSFFVRQGQRPIVFLAGGTGFAPVKAMVEKLLAAGDNRELHIYWGGSAQESFYSALPSQWQAGHRNIRYHPVLSDGAASWSGRRGLVHHAVLQDFGTLKDVDVYACGSPAMIDAARADFIKAGLPANQFYADAFLPASRAV